jgi:hypothetical protein
MQLTRYFLANAGIASAGRGGMAMMASTATASERTDDLMASPEGDLTIISTFVRQ